MTADPLLIKYVREPNSFTLDFYLAHEGYEGLKKALSMAPEAVVEMVKASGLRGRGGAGFPTGMKWQFVDRKSTKPRYIACNADESEPGTFKDHLLMERNPHLLIEGCAIACYAIGAKVAYIYIRGEFLHVQRVLERAIDEASMTATLRELIEESAGGVPDGRTLKAVIPGGSSVPILLPDQLDTQASFDGVQKAGSLLGSAGIIVLDDTTCMVWLAENLLHFYRHESCGKCTPCREGTDWLHKILRKIERGEGLARDLDLLASISNNVAGKTLCAFGDAAVTPVVTTLKHFRHEYEAHIKEGRCTLSADRRARQPLGAHRNANPSLHRA